MQGTFIKPVDDTQLTRKPDPLNSWVWIPEIIWGINGEITDVYRKKEQERQIWMLDVGRCRINKVLAGKTWDLNKRKNISLISTTITLVLINMISTLLLLASSCLLVSPFFPLHFQSIFLKKQVELPFINYNPNNMLHHFKVQLWSYLNFYFKYNWLELSFALEMHFTYHTSRRRGKH